MIVIASVVLFTAMSGAQTLAPDPPASDDYPLTADSLAQSDVPHGETFTFALDHSATFPNTSRTISVYVPAQFNPSTAACVFVELDGLGFNASTVFDNLIAHHEMPITIAIGVSPGTVRSSRGDNPRFDRSFEFDTKSDRLVRFIADEVFSEVEQHRTANGRPILLSRKASDHMIAGGSTGGIAAFTAAWEHPEIFSRVFTAIGTFVGMRGGESYYVEVRKTEPKPIRIFIEDGTHDEWPGGPEMGDWWMSNLTMNRALEFAGYDVTHVWGNGTHNGNHASSVFPDAMRWLWRGWPTPVLAGTSQNPVLSSVIEPGEGWHVVGRLPDQGSAIAAAPNGKIYCWNSRTRTVEEISADVSGNSPPHSKDQMQFALAATHDGGFYVSDRAHRQILAISHLHAAPKVFVSGIAATSLTVRANGDLYATAVGDDGAGSVWRFPQQGKKSLVASGLSEPWGIAFSPNDLWLSVTQHDSRSSFNYRVKEDGTLDAGEPFYDFFVPTWSRGSKATSAMADKSGLVYVATAVGVQVMDATAVWVQYFLFRKTGRRPVYVSGVMISGPSTFLAAIEFMLAS